MNYDFINTFVPTLATLARITNAVPINIPTPLNKIAYVYPPLSFEISAPAIGVPINVANPTILQITFVSKRHT
jgi:hypothetical protein